MERCSADFQFLGFVTRFSRKQLLSKISKKIDTLLTLTHSSQKIVNFSKKVTEWSQIDYPCKTFSTSTIVTLLQKYLQPSRKTLNNDTNTNFLISLLPEREALTVIEVEEEEDVLLNLQRKRTYIKQWFSETELPKRKRWRWSSPFRAGHDRVWWQLWLRCRWILKTRAQWNRLASQHCQTNRLERGNPRSLHRDELPVNRIRIRVCDMVRSEFQRTFLSSKWTGDENILQERYDCRWMCWSCGNLCDLTDGTIESVHAVREHSWWHSCASWSCSITRCYGRTVSRISRHGSREVSRSAYTFPRIFWSTVAYWKGMTEENRYGHLSSPVPLRLSELGVHHAFGYCQDEAYVDSKKIKVHFAFSLI